VLVGHRAIGAEDDRFLLPEERAPLSGSVAKVLRQSGAARRVARGLLAELGHPDAPLPPRRRMPLAWPAGIVGSLAHDAEVAVAAVAPAAALLSLGIDVEPAEPLPPLLVAKVATERERAAYPAALLESRLLFCVKEAVYKARNPLDGIVLEFHDVEVDLAAGLATVLGMHRVQVRVIAAPRVVALATIPHPPA